MYTYSYLEELQVLQTDASTSEHPVRMAYYAQQVHSEKNAKQVCRKRAIV